MAFTNPHPLATPPKTVLIVEDQAIVAKDIRQSLERLGYVVVGSADSARDALDAARLLRPDLVLMDIRLRGSEDGIAAATAIRAERAVPVVFLTAHSDTETVQRAVDADPFGYVVKPFNEQELRCAIEVALARHDREQVAKTYADEARRMALIDELTGLYNRRGFMIAAERQLAAAAASRVPATAFFADVDGLRGINASCGHRAGDTVLKAVSDVLKGAFAEGDVIGRLSGDEFAILGIGMDKIDASQAVANVQKAMSQRCQQVDLGIRVTLSLGIAPLNSLSTIGLELALVSADASMFRRKRNQELWPTSPGLFRSA
jgi:two-component system, cell cycle response regulator